jgi:hypothetical protein
MNPFRLGMRTFGSISVFTRCDLDPPCAYRNLNPGILVVQSAQNRATEDASNRLGGT